MATIGAQLIDDDREARIRQANGAQLGLEHCQCDWCFILRRLDEARTALDRLTTHDRETTQQRDAAIDKLHRWTAEQTPPHEQAPDQSGSVARVARREETLQPGAAQSVVVPCDCSLYGVCALHAATRPRGCVCHGPAFRSSLCAVGQSGAIAAHADIARHFPDRDPAAVD